MKKILILLYLTIFIIIIGSCNSVQEKKTQAQRKSNPQYIDQNEYIRREKNGFTIFTIDGHEYINGSPIVHNENCPNTNHIIKYNIHTANQFKDN